MLIRHRAEGATSVETAISLTMPAMNLYARLGFSSAQMTFHRLHDIDVPLEDLRRLRFARCDDV
jgi:hypothetical protein